MVSAFAGGGGSSVSGFADGMGLSATFNSPIGVALTSAGDVIVADSNNDLIRKVTSTGFHSIVSAVILEFVVCQPYCDCCVVCTYTQDWCLLLLEEGVALDMWMVLVRLLDSMFRLVWL